MPGLVNIRPGLNEAGVFFVLFFPCIQVRSVVELYFIFNYSCILVIISC